MKRPLFRGRGPLAIGTCALFAACLAAQVRVNYHNENFTLSDFDHFSATFETSGVAFDGDGNPLKIEFAASGTTITGNKAEGHAIRQANAGYYLQDSTITGSATLVMNSAAAQKTAKTPSTETTNTKIQSEVLKYSGTATDGRIEFPGAVVIDSSSSGTSQSKDNKTTQFARTLHLTGAKGFVTVLMNGTGNNALQTGEMDGPIVYSGKSENTSEGKTDTTTFDGKADHMQMDFTKEPRTLTLTGHVTLHSQGTVAAGDISADTVVVTVDANLKPIKVDITGSPAQTVYHKEPPR